MLLPALAAAALTGTFSGSYSLPATATPVPLTLQVRPARTLVLLGAGHAARTEVRATPTAGGVRISLPGRPSPLTFALRLRAGSLSGTARQGTLTGTATLRRGPPVDEGFLGAYRLASGHLLGVVSLFGAWFGVDYDAAEIRRLYRTAAGRFAVGAGSGVRAPPVGSARFSGAAVNWRGVAGRRLPLRQEEVRFADGGAALAGTLTLPAGPGPFPAVALVHGSGPTARDESSIYASFFASRGFAVLAYDKRGIGESSGRYPGERASPEAIETYARDAAAALRFLAAQPEVDRARVGFAGDSQAGWIMPLAAREPAARFVVAFVGPAVSVGEQELWASLVQGGAVEFAAAERQVRAGGPSGFDPLASLRALRIPGLWLLGGNDRNIPTGLTVERLESVGGELAYRVFPKANHSLIESTHGFPDEQDRSARYPAALFPTIDDWLKAHVPRRIPGRQRAVLATRNERPRRHVGAASSTASQTMPRLRP
jgi:dienelactone hydrolase